MIYFVGKKREGGGHVFCTCLAFCGLNQASLTSIDILGDGRSLILSLKIAVTDVGMGVFRLKTVSDG